MNKILHGVLAILLVAATADVGWAEPSEKAMQEASFAFLKAVTSDLLQNPDTAKYFPGMKLKDIGFEPTDRWGGWLISWSYMHAVHFVPNPDKGMQLGEVPVFENSQGIVFEIFVSYENGSAMVSRIKDYPILEKPNLTASFDLQTGDKNAPLSKIDAIIKSHLGAFRKAMDAS